MARSVPAIDTIHEPRPLSSTVKSAASKTRRRSILSVLGQFCDLPSLISGPRPSERGVDITFSGYADEACSDTQNSRPVRPSPAMLSSQDDRPERRTPGDRLYNFLTRSRSRSRSQNDQPAPMPTPRTPNPASKPASRIPSRPLSSTTSTTVTPSATPKPRKPADKMPRPSTKTQREHKAAATTAPAAASRPTTPKASGARQVLHDLFGIPLGRKASSRSCSRSRPPSPTLAAPLDVPPLPTDDELTPRPRQSTATLDRGRSGSISPTPQTRVLRVTNDSSTGSQGTTTTAASVKITKFFGGSSIKSRGNTPPGTHPASSSKRTSRSSTTNAAPSYTGLGTPVLPPLPSMSSIPSIGGIVAPGQHPNGAATAIGSGPSRIVPPSQTHKRSTSAIDARAPLPPLPPPLPGGANANAPGPQGMAPKNNTVPGASKPTPNGSGIAMGVGGSSAQRFRHAAKGSLDASYRYRNGAPAMSRLTEESSARGSVASGDAAVLPPHGLAPLVVANGNGNSKMSKVSSAGGAGGGGGGLIVPADVGQPLPSPVARTASRMSSQMRATKHGSFDFERPGWGTAPVAMQRSESGGTTGTESSGVPRDRERERESVYGPGLAGVGTLQRETSVRRAQEREEAVRLREKVRRTGLDGYVDKGKDREREREKGRAGEMTREKETSRRTAHQDSLHPPSENLHASTSTGRSAPTPVAGGKTSSMSRAPPIPTAAGGSANKRSLLPQRGASVKRLVGLGANQLGAFSFEPAVPSPTRSNTSSVATAHEVALPPGFAAKAERERERLSHEKERQQQLSKTRSRDRERDRAPVPVPPAYGDLSPTIANGFVPLGKPSANTTTITTANAANEYAGSTGGGAGSWGRASAKKATSPGAGHRSGVKGRSLDLGLGLAWASTKVREEALLPTSGFFARTASGTSASSGQGASSARTTSGTSSSGVGQSPNLGAVRSVRDVERSKAGKEVAEIFRSALDPQGYAMFKSYVHKFDAHEIPFDGPTGIVTLVEDLLAVRSHLDGDKKQRLVDKFIRILLSQA